MSVFRPADDLVVLDLYAFDGLAQRHPTDRHAVKVQHAGGALNFVQDGRNAAGSVDIFHVPLARWGNLA